MQFTRTPEGRALPTAWVGVGGQTLFGKLVSVRLPRPRIRAFSTNHGPRQSLLPRSSHRPVRGLSRQSRPALEATSVMLPLSAIRGKICSVSQRVPRKFTAMTFIGLSGIGPTPATQINPPTCAGRCAQRRLHAAPVTKVTSNEVLTAFFRPLNIKIERLVACRLNAVANGLADTGRPTRNDDWSFHSS